MTTHVVADGIAKRKPTVDEMEILLVNRIPDLVRRYKEGGLDPVGVNKTLQMVLEGTIITEQKTVVVTSPKPKQEKFSLLADLGTITVPENYVSGTRLGTFRSKYQDGEKKSFYFYNENITDANFSNPSRILKPGDKLWVRAFQQVASGTTTTKERMSFLSKQKGNIWTGAQGVSLVWEQKRDQLPKGKWFVSYDKKENLWQDSDGSRGLPCVFAYSDGDFGFDLGSFEIVWASDDLLLCFCDLSQTSGT